MQSKHLMLACLNWLNIANSHQPHKLHTNFPWIFSMELQGTLKVVMHWQLHSSSLQSTQQNNVYRCASGPKGVVAVYWISKFQGSPKLDLLRLVVMGTQTRLFELLPVYARCWPSAETDTRDFHCHNMAKPNAWGSRYR